MKKIIKSMPISDLSYFLTFELEIPSQCPCCRTALEANFLNAFHVVADSASNFETGKLFALYFCPKCEECFMAHYSIEILDCDYPSRGKLLYLTPYAEAKTEFSKEITDLSPSFVSIYNQSEKAESIGLSEICGLGYRKSLEFLVKDYAIHLHPEDSELIKNKMLSPCIAEYIDNKKIKALSTASAWIGNDEAHYVRKRENYSIEHLKAFIRAVASFIDSDLSYEQALSLLLK